MRNDTWRGWFRRVRQTLAGDTRRTTKGGQRLWTAPRLEELAGLDQLFAKLDDSWLDL